MKAGWRVVRVGDICTFNYGKALPESARKGGITPVFGSNGIVGFHDSSITSGRTIVIGRKGSFGEVHYSEISSWPIDTAYFVDEASTEQDMRWLFYRLGCLGLNQMNKAAAVPGLNRDDAYRQEMLLPPLPEQRRIAAILDKADTLRTKRREALAQLDGLTQAIFIEMFGDPVSNERGWPTKCVSELCGLVRGSSPRPQGDPKFFGGPVPRLMVADITRDGWSVTPRIDSLTLEGAKRSRPVAAGTVVMAVSGNVGLVSRLAVDACVHDGFVAFVGLDESICEPGFLLALLHFSKAVHEQSKAGAIFINLTTSDIKSMRIPLPPMKEQIEFGRRMMRLQCLRQTAQSASATLDGLFASLQHHAFRGEL